MDDQEDSVYQSPAYYQMMHGSRCHDLPFYLQQASELRPRHILEYGIGAGRVALPLCREGHDVTGVDLSGEMLGELERLWQQQQEQVRQRLRWHRGDARSLDLGQRFELILCPFNGIAHHHGESALRAFFGQVDRHLQTCGRLVFDVLIPCPHLLAGSRNDVPWFRHPDSGEVCRFTEISRYDDAAQRLTITAQIRFMQREQPPQELKLHLQLLFPEQIPALLSCHGFELVEQQELGDVIAFVCRRR